MSDDERIIRFPGAKPATPGRPGDARRAGGPPAKGAKSDSGGLPVPDLPPGVPPELANLDEDQRKAVSIVLSGMAFVLVGIKPSPSGADFFTAVHGEPADLRNAESHLPGVIERAYTRKGI
ncbi:MAG: hypothetical protein H0W72_17205 [Planctomycetes bacterium]|nr:hypothetical protein [Planctomycetota bacterium]